uniref:uncharacterized protein LOC122601572 n=1 Tax=Erigeron canadensis TaxID=72917 RepID=UPI001CB9C962|nr:uncharacterized protein LOC122601572 [Erigeron canadensis]
MKSLSLFSSEILLHFFIFFTLKVLSFTTHQTISYSDHCQSFAPEAIPTDKVFTRYPFLEPVTSHYTGGQNILDQDELSQRSILFAATQNLFKTNVVDTYKIQARLSFFSSNIYYRPSNFSYTKSNYSRVGWKYRRPLVFRLDGFWSVSTSRLCMVGSAHWYSKEGNPVKLDAVLKLKFARFISLNTSLVSGILESLVSPDDSNYFDSISMLGFPRVSPFKYNYTSVSNEECNGVENKALEAESVTSMQSLDICGIFTQRFTTYKLEYPSTICKNCSLFGLDIGYLPSFVSLYAIQCSPNDKKLRFLVEFKDRRYTPYDQSFIPDISLIGDGTWNGTKDELCIVACHILNKDDPLGSAHVGDCSIRLSLWFLNVRSIKKTHTTEGQIWSTKTTQEIKSLRPVKFQSFDHSPENYGWKYEYTQMEKVRQICPSTKNAKRKGVMYQPENYEDFQFDMLVRHKNMGWTGSAVPIFVGGRLYNLQRIGATNFSQSTADVSTASYKGPLNISYEISFRLNNSTISRSGISSLNLSSMNRIVHISAEGFYDDESARICMVGCRNLNSNTSHFDCEIKVNIQFPYGNRTFAKGSIHSLRRKTDALYFEHLDFFSLTYGKSIARKTIWRIELEIIMVLISDTLVCVFIGQQLFHLKKRPEMANFISVLMMLILTFGHMVPLVLNFEAVFTNGRDQKYIPFGDKGGWVELNEVVVRIVTMVAFILQFRLLQLTWAAKKDHWIHEIWTLVICLPTYIMGGTVLLLMNRKNNNHIIGLRSYAGLALDGFLFPQIILNIFQVSKGNALSFSFYIGTTFVRLLPHVYDLYRGPKSIGHQFDRLYIYANPRADFYSPGSDIIIVCGGIVFAVMLLLQQRFGGRLNLPKIFGRGLVEYEMVPVASDES